MRSSGAVQEEYFTTEDTEFHGEKDDFRTKTPCYSVYSVVNSYLLDTFDSAQSTKGRRVYFVTQHYICFFHVPLKLKLCSLLVGTLLITILPLTILIIISTVLPYVRYLRSLFINVYESPDMFASEN